MPRCTVGRVAVIVGVGLLGAGVACSGDDGGGSTATTLAPASAPVGTSAPQPLTMPQAEVLATMRSANHRAGSAAFSTTVRDGADVIDLRGVVDWQQHVGSAVFRAAGRTDANGNGLMQWNFEHVAAHPGGAVDGPPPPPPADGTWVQRPIDPTQSTLDTLFLLLLSVASPQPDNPQLLRQTDAAYLGTEIVHGQTVSVFTGPTSDDATAPAATEAPAAADPSSGGAALTYWVAADGSLVRMSARLGGTQTVTVDFSAAPATPTEFLPDLVAAAEQPASSED